MPDCRAHIIGHAKQRAAGIALEFWQATDGLRGSTASRTKDRLELNVFAALLSYNKGGRPWIKRAEKNWLEGWSSRADWRLTRPMRQHGNACWRWLKI
jgi:hypothetical protein